MHYQKKDKKECSDENYKKISNMFRKTLILFFIVLIRTGTVECAEKSNSHYTLQLNKMSLTKSSDEFADPIQSCVIHPSSIKIKHYEHYWLPNNARKLYYVATTVSITIKDYNNLVEYLEQKKTVYVECHNSFRSYWTLFKIDPNRSTIKKLIKEN